MAELKVTRAHLKSACDSQNWDLLDKLLEISDEHIDDNALYTDTWGEWWGLLLECVVRNYEDGVRVLLKHGAKKQVSSWGDGIPMTPIEAAADKPAILALLESETRPAYARKGDPPLPVGEIDRVIDRQSEVREKNGLDLRKKASEEDESNES